MTSVPCTPTCSQTKRLTNSQQAFCDMCDTNYATDLALRTTRSLSLGPFVGSTPSKLCPSTSSYSNLARKDRKNMSISSLASSRPGHACLPRPNIVGIGCSSDKPAGLVEAVVSSFVLSPCRNRNGQNLRRNGVRELSRQEG